MATISDTLLPAHAANSPEAETELKSIREKGANKYFFGYQMKWLLDQSMVKIWEKSRRIGATYVQSYEDVYDIVNRTEYRKGRPVKKVYFTSADESAAIEYIEYCAQWAKLFDAGARKLGEVVIDKEKDIKALSVEFSNGGHIYALTSNPKRFRSKGGKVVWDEAAHHADQKQMWKAQQASAQVWGYPIRILSTHNGKQCLFFSFIYKIRHGKKKGWSLHTTTIKDAINDGLCDKVYGHPTSEAERAEYLEMLRDGADSIEDFDEEYMCIAVDSSTAFIPEELIYAVESDHCLMSWEELEALSEGDLYAGYDVARKRHLSVFWIAQRLGDMRYTRYIQVFKKAKFRIQMDFLDRVMKLPRLRRICIDATGIGMKLAEDAQELYGKYRVEDITFTPASKDELATEGKTAIEDIMVRIPIDQVIRDSFHSIKKISSTGGHDRYDADTTDKSGHADHWWAFCLSELAAKLSKAKSDSFGSAPLDRSSQVVRDYQSSLGPLGMADYNPGARMLRKGLVPTLESFGK